VSWRLAWLEKFLPLSVLEISHFLGSLVGIGLLLLARGLLRRLDAAYVLTAALLACGVAFSLLKGLDYEEAIAMLVLLGVLLPCRRHFYRKASLFSQRFDPGWIILIVTVLICAVWLGMFSYKHVEYSNDLWWRFTFYGNAPRFLRTMVGSVAVILFFGLAKLLSPGSPKLPATRDEDLNKVMIIVRTSYKTYANLALLGDKTFLFSQNGNAFIMYGIEGRSWVGMGDPIGQVEEYAELVWSFREMCDRYDGWPVFYEVEPENIYLYLDLGLTLLKLGEQGRVPLENFALKGSARKGLRYTSHKLEREGCIFEVVPTEGVPSLLPELKHISDTWLAGKAAREKGFSLGFFDSDYLKRFPVGIVRRDGKIIAFANIWAGSRKREVSIDLMRYLPEAPRGVMEYLFVELMLWGRQEKYRLFNLGMAPLSGIHDHALAPLWNRLGAFVFRHGEHFYNLKGLRQYKDKFDPEWEPRYLACPGGLVLPRILTNIASLISGGLKGVISR
jgi:phosphatidylglycerol lysyltransferase